jgi:hypothetical protein
MSTGYYIYERIPIAEFFGGRLDKYRIQDANAPNAEHGHRCITDGQNNFLWVSGDPIRCFTRYMPNGRPGFILQAIANEFEVEIFSEHDGDDPSYVPLGKPTDEEITVMRTEWRIECAELDRELENVRVTWRETEITAGS